MRIVIGVDGSPQSFLGVRWVAHLPLSSHDDVLLVSVVGARLMPGAWGYTDVDVNHRAIDAARSAGAWETQRITQHTLRELRALPCPVRTVQLEGHPREALEQAVRRYDADLLVVGAHGRGRLATVLFGSVSQSLLRTLPTSMLVAREPVGVPQRVLLATDRSGSGLAAASHVAGFPLAPGTVIDVITVTGDGPAWRPGQGAVDAGDFAAAEQRHRSGTMDQLAAVLDAAGRSGMAMERGGDPTHAILAVAEERRSDLIVMGTGGIDGSLVRVRGSVWCAVSKAAACSTLVVAIPRLAVARAGSMHGGVDPAWRAMQDPSPQVH